MYFTFTSKRCSVQIFILFVCLCVCVSVSLFVCLCRVCTTVTPIITSLVLQRYFVSLVSYCFYMLIIPFVS